MFYFLELDNPNPGFDACFESSSFADASKDIETIAAHLGIKSVFALMSCKEYDCLMPPGYEEAVVPWFDAQEGIDWVEAVVGHIRSNSSSVQNHDRLLADLLLCQTILSKAQAIGAKWHFGMDI